MCVQLLLTLNFPVSFSSSIQFAVGTPWITITFLGPVQAFLPAETSSLVKLLGSYSSLVSRREPCTTTWPLILPAYWHMLSSISHLHVAMFLLEDSRRVFCFQFCFQVFIDAQLHFRFQKQCESVGLVLIQTNDTGFFFISNSTFWIKRGS